jgi:hypothetical protein
MITKQLGLLGAIACLPAFAQASSAPTSMETLAPHQHRPIKDRVEHGDGSATSANWSGYAVTGSSFTSVEGSWIVPTAACKPGEQFASFWVGLDGYNSDSVEQTGTDSDCSGKTPQYYAWYEFYPNPAFEIRSVPVKPGDHVSAQVVYSASQFTVTITDVTTGKYFSKTLTVEGAERSSAEWIAEAPCCNANNGSLPLGDFGTVLFGDDSTGVTSTNHAIDSATAGPIGSFSTIERIRMAAKDGATEAFPSGLSSDGTSFSVTWASQ